MSRRLFLSHVRRGASAGIGAEDPIAGGIPEAPVIHPHLTLSAGDATAGLAVAGPALQILGPAHVMGFNPHLVTRVQPGAGTTNGPSNELAYIEFSRAELPWLFTPAGPNRALHGRLRPWLVLIVLPLNGWERFDEAASPLPVLEVGSRELPDLSDSWAWAHAQVTADDEAGMRVAIRRNDPETRARLLCPRRLAEERPYRAFVVPAFEGGRRAGLGDPQAADPARAQQPAWSVGRSARVTLPVYYSWSFVTGPREGFEDLASRLTRAPAASLSGFGTREVDVRKPWPGLASLSTLTGQNPDLRQTIAMDGALKIPGPPPDGSLNTTNRAKFESLLEEQLNLPSRISTTEAADPERRSVTAPIYGSRFRGLGRLPETAGWVRDLNLDIRRRAAASYGARYVQEHQEFLMARAWDQLPDIERANRLRRIGELAAVAADAMHRRHVQTLDAAALVSVAAPARGRTRAGEGVTLQQMIAASPVPNAAATPAFTRVARSHGRVARGIRQSPSRAIIERGLAGTIAIDRVTVQRRRLGLAAAPPTGLSDNDPAGQRAAAAWRLVTETERRSVAIGLSFLQRLVDARGAQATSALADASRLVEQRLSGAVTAQLLRSASVQGIASRLERREDAALAVAAVTRYREHLVEAGGGTVAIRPQPAAPAPAGTPLEASSLRGAVATALIPSRLIVKRLGDRIEVPPEFQPADPLGPVMAGPRFPAPLALPLFQKQPDLVLPGIGGFPPDSVTLLETNPPFIESLLVGANHEMNRELLWREFPTDQRGSPFRHFWPRAGNAPEIGPVPSWTGRLGSNLSGASGEQIVLLVRGEVLRRFPGTIVFAAPAQRRQGAGPAFELLEGQALPPEFAMRLTDDTSIYAFRLTEEDVRSSGAQAGWFFVFQEPLTTPRFGFDLTPASGAAAFASWDDLTWDHVPMDRGFAVGGRDLAPPANHGGAAWNRTAADVARIALQRPFRVAFHADVLLRSH